MMMMLLQHDVADRAAASTAAIGRIDIKLDGRKRPHELLGVLIESELIISVFKIYWYRTGIWSFSATAPSLSLCFFLFWDWYGVCGLRKWY